MKDDNVTEFYPGCEVCIAIIGMTRVNTGESFVGPVHIGYCPQSQGADAGNLEIWIEQEGKRVALYAHQLPQFIKQLKRAQRTAEDDRT